MRRGPEDLSTRLLAKVKVDPLTGCWNWQAAINKHGYGIVKVGGKCVLAHRASAAVWIGLALEDERQALHHCDNRRCINPYHLFLGTTQDNVRDRVSKRRSGGGSHPGESNPCAKLTAEQVVEIRRLRGEGRTLAAIAEVFDITPSLVGMIGRRDIWRNVA